MNTVTNLSEFQRESKSEKPTVDEVLKEAYQTNKTAFIGRCGYGPPNSLYLIIYDCIALASDPSFVWTSVASVIIDKWVDIEITIKDSGK